MSSVQGTSRGTAGRAAVRGPGPRERLLASAQRLTAERGVGVGVDAILEDASVARRSLYQHFGGKDGLIAESLRVAADADEARYRAALDRAGSDPRRRVLAVFAELDRTTSAPGFHGCRYVSAELALTDPDHPAHDVTREYTARLHAIFAAELEQAGHPDPAGAADQIIVLIDGVLVVGAIRPESHPALAVLPLVELVFDAGNVPA
jgi:AcrR family transcriptional regulator